MTLQGPEAFCGVQVGVAWAEHMARRVVDVEEDRVETGGPVTFGIWFAAHHREEVVVDQPRPRVGGERVGDGQQTILMPPDHGTERVDDGQRPDPLVGKHRLGGIAEPQSTYQDVELPAVDRTETEVGQLDLGRGEQARHQVLVVELDLEHVGVDGRVVALAQTDRPDRRLLPGKLLKARTHDSSPSTSSRGVRSFSSRVLSSASRCALPCRVRYRGPKIASRASSSRRTAPGG